MFVFAQDCIFFLDNLFQIRHSMVTKDFYKSKMMITSDFAARMFELKSEEVK